MLFFLSSFFLPSLPPALSKQSSQLHGIDASARRDYLLQMIAKLKEYYLKVVIQFRQVPPLQGIVLSVPSFTFIFCRMPCNFTPPFFYLSCFQSLEYCFLPLVLFIPTCLLHSHSSFIEKCRYRGNNHIKLQIKYIS